MEYIPVMVAEHEIPLILSTYQMGIRDDIEKAFEAKVKMQTTPAEKVGGGLAGNLELDVYRQITTFPMTKAGFPIHWNTALMIRPSPSSAAR